MIEYKERWLREHAAITSPEGWRRSTTGELLKCQKGLVEKEDLFIEKYISQIEILFDEKYFVANTNNYKNILKFFIEYTNEFYSEEVHEYVVNNIEIVIQEHEDNLILNSNEDIESVMNFNKSLFEITSKNKINNKIKLFVSLGEIKSNVLELDVFNSEDFTYINLVEENREYDSFYDNDEIVNLLNIYYKFDTNYYQNLDDFKLIFDNKFSEFITYTKPIRVNDNYKFDLQINNLPGGKQGINFDFRIEVDNKVSELYTFILKSKEKVEYEVVMNDPENITLRTNTELVNMKHVSEFYINTSSHKIENVEIELMYYGTGEINYDVQVDNGFASRSKVNFDIKCDYNDIIEYFVIVDGIKSNKMKIVFEK